MALAPQEAHDDVLYQLGAVAAFCRAAGVPLVHAKMHGALSTHVARALARPWRTRSSRPCATSTPALPLVVLPASELAAAAARAGLPDRPRGLSGARLRRDGRC